MGAIPVDLEEGGGAIAAFPGTEDNRLKGHDYNWAREARVRQRLKDELVPLVQHIRDDRKQLNDMWSGLFKVWSLEHEQQGYTGRSNLYIPAGKKTLETLVSQLVSATFPGEDNFGVEPMDPDDARHANLAKLILKHRIEKTAKVRVAAEKFYRQLCVTGNSPVKVYYERRLLKELRPRRRGANAMLARELRAFERMGETKLHDGPVFKPIDIANFYAWPADVDDLSDCSIIFEDLTVSISHLRAKAKEKKYVEESVDRLGEGIRQREADYASDTKLSAQGLNRHHETGGTTDGWGLVDISEVYVDFDPRAASKKSEEEPVPFLITMSADGEILRAVEQPFWHARPPYLLGRMGTVVGRLYGTGYAESIRALNILLNDQTNQSMDCANYALNPIVLTNPNLIMGKLPNIEPGIEWETMDVANAVRFERPPTDLIQAGSVLTSQTMSWINDFSHAPPVLQGGSAPGRAFRTATGIGTAQRNATMPLKEVVKLCEKEVWEPMLFFFWALDQQFAEDDVLLKYQTNMAAPMQVQRVNPRDVQGDFQFNWLASSQTENQQVKGAQITSLLQVLSQPGLNQLLQMNGVRVDPTPLIRRLYEEVYGFRDVDKVIMPQPMQPQLPPGAPPGAPQGGPDAAAMMQQLMGSNGALDGNGEFEGMREGADEIAASMGAMGAGG